MSLSVTKFRHEDPPFTHFDATVGCETTHFSHVQGNVRDGEAGIIHGTTSHENAHHIMYGSGEHRGMADPPQNDSTVRILIVLSISL